MTAPLYALFCGKAADTVEWWDKIFPLVEAYFVRMVSLYVAIETVEHRPISSCPTSSLLGACMLRVLDALPQSCREEMHSAVPDDAGHFRDRFLPGSHASEIGWALKKLGFDILDTPLPDDIERRVQFCEQQRFTATGELPPVELADMHYPTFTHIPRHRAGAALSELQRFRPKQLPPRISAIRVTLGESSPAEPDDPSAERTSVMPRISRRKNCGSGDAECGSSVSITSPHRKSCFWSTTRPLCWLHRSPD